MSRRWIDDTTHKEIAMNLFRIILLIATFTFGSAAWSAAVNINAATAEQLTELTGVGMKKAEAIVAYRNQNGEFKSADDLANVRGIGTKTVEKNRSDILLK